MFQRLKTLLKGFLSIFVGGLERNNPEALLEAEKENLRKQISQFNQGLAAHAGLVERLMSDHKKLKAEEIDLAAKVKVLLQQGKRELAAEFAARYQAVDKKEDEVLIQLQEAEATYKELTKARDVAVKAARDKIEKLTNGLSEMKTHKAMAELNEMAQGMIGAIGGSGDTLNRLEEVIEGERTKAKGRARVAKDSVDLSGITATAEAQKFDGEAALAMFEAQMGLSSPVTAPQSAEQTEAPVGMGPISQ